MTQEEKWQVEAKDARWERTVRRLIIALIVTIVMMFACNAFWLYVWMQYDYTSEDAVEEVVYTQDGNGFNNINTGGQGDINNGANINYPKDYAHENAE